MADNLTKAAYDAGATLGTDDITSVHYPRVKLIHGADGANAGDVADGNPLPIDDAGGSLTVDFTALAATVHAISAKVATDAIMDGLTACTPKFAVIDAAGSGDNTIVAAVAGKKIRVLAVTVTKVAGATAGTTFRFESGASGTALTGQMAPLAGTPWVLPFNPAGWFETVAATLLNLEISAAESCDGCLTYIEV